MLGHDTSSRSGPSFVSQALGTTKDSTPDPQTPHRTMPSLNHQHQIFQIPHQPVHYRKLCSTTSIVSKPGTLRRLPSYLRLILPRNLARVLKRTSPEPERTP
jgi:hypothetical protein